MHEDGRASRPRCILVKTDHGVETDADPHKIVPDVETTAETATMGYQYDLASSKFLNDIVLQGKQRKNVHRPPCQGCDSASTASGSSSGIIDMTWGTRVLWTVANMSTVGKPQNSTISAVISGGRPHTVVIG